MEESSSNLPSMSCVLLRDVAEAPRSQLTLQRGPSRLSLNSSALSSSSDGSMMDADSLTALLGDFDNEDEWQRTKGQQLQGAPTVSACSQLDLVGCEANGHFDGRTTDTNPLRDACDNMLPGFVPDLRAARPESRSGASESRLATAREAQRRFRQRHKVYHRPALPFITKHRLVTPLQCLLSVWHNRVQCGYVCRPSPFRSNLSLPALLQSCASLRRVNSSWRAEMLCWKSLPR